ncbi:DUF305 domain-containing protein [Streptomyces sp. WMMC500]|uniref:DUF305 domain-containing protein n=1 Tax=Streptomyces sp. WMMC500 TaxID=3015154 RepID=UPI00248AACC1|nr:DUF305 domain-containing protein [Streptomyces sp. WMMC500]WBB61579.1 DUF305 domain-containing protein [Streptomyces sp. WMMC500]
MNARPPAASPLTALLLTAALLVPLAGCAGSGSPPPARERAAASGSTPAASPAGPAGFSHVDSGWVQLALPMTEQALPLLDLAPSRGADPDLAAWAADVAAGHRADVAELRGLRDRMGLPDTNVHEGHAMPGMVTAAHLARARQAEGAAFDRLLLRLVRDHLTHSKKISDSERRNGTGPAARDLAAALAAARADALRTAPALPAR